MTVEDLVDRHVLRLQAGPTSSVRSMAFSPRERVLACTTGDSHVSFWDLDSQEELPPLATAGEPARSLTFSPDGVILAIGTWAGHEARPELSVWDWKNGRRLASFDIAARRNQSPRLLT